MKRRNAKTPSGRLQRPRRTLMLGIVAGVALIGALTGALVAYEGGIGAPPPARAATIGGPFELVDQDGRTVTDASYRGKWLLIYFGYTHCPDACPTALNDMAQALEGLGAQRAKVQPLFITVDPERDTPSVLKDYTAAFQADIVGLTGSAAQIAEAARRFRVYYKRDDATNPDYTMSHSSVIYLMDPDGRFVTNFTHETAPNVIHAKLVQTLS